MHIGSIDDLCLEFYTSAKKNLVLDRMYIESKNNKKLVINKILEYTKEFCYNNNVHLDTLHKYEDVLIFNIYFDYQTFLEAVVYYKDNAFTWNLTKHV